MHFALLHARELRAGARRETARPVQEYTVQGYAETACVLEEPSVCPSGERSNCSMYMYADICICVVFPHERSSSGGGGMHQPLRTHPAWCLRRGIDAHRRRHIYAHVGCRGVTTQLLS